LCQVYGPDNFTVIGYEDRMNLRKG
jgi:hypothetical protein